jgi:perosamine synthetase
MYTVLLEEGFDRDEVAGILRDRGIETRPVFPPMHLLPPYAHLAAPGSLPVGEDLARRGMNLPTGAHLEEAHVDRICVELRAAIS